MASWRRRGGPGAGRRGAERSCSEMAAATEEGAAGNGRAERVEADGGSMFWAVGLCGELNCIVRLGPAGERESSPRVGLVPRVARFGLHYTNGLQNEALVGLVRHMVQAS
jgi:hypothetical protein